jgi:uncharacterized protein (UPF0264 family)
MKLLVSVRSVDEALAALEGGADLIDIKEPERGPLGKADDFVIAAIVAAVAGRRPVSAAMGEICESNGTRIHPAGLEFIKFGLANQQGNRWRDQLLELSSRTSSTLVPTAYADCERARSPTINSIVAFVLEHRFRVLLIDTYVKDGRNLFSWISPERLSETVAILGEFDCRVALAGSLAQSDFAAMAEINPEWVAVRGAACVSADRTSRVDLENVRLLKSALATSETPAPD